MLPFRHPWTYTLVLNWAAQEHVYYSLTSVRRAAFKARDTDGFKSVEVLAHFRNDKHGPPISIVWDRIVDGRDHTRTGEARKSYGT